MEIKPINISSGQELYETNYKYESNFTAEDFIKIEEPIEDTAEDFIKIEGPIEDTAEDFIKIEGLIEDTNSSDNFLVKNIKIEGPIDQIEDSNSPSEYFNYNLKTDEQQTWINNDSHKELLQNQEIPKNGCKIKFEVDFVQDKVTYTDVAVNNKSSALKLGQKCTTKEALSRHQKVHKGKKSFKCDLCEKGFADNYHLAVHKRCHTGEKPFVCSVCQRGFAEKGLLKRHSRVHTGEEPYECKTCGCSFKNSSLLKYHSMIHDYTKTINNCQKCDKTCPCGEHVMEYKMMMEKKPFICEKCYMCFKCKNDLVCHSYIHKGEVPFMCDKCGKGFKTNSHFLRHLSTHTGKKPYQCTYCDKRYSQNGHLNVHIKTTHVESSNTAQDSKVQCSSCEKWILSSKYKRHLRTHENENENKCSHCEKVLSTFNALRLHNRIHTGEKPFKCSDCNAAFSQQHSLNHHKATKHSDIVVHKETYTLKLGKYQCLTCNKECKTENALSRHHKVHEKKSFKCGLCEKSFADNYHLVEHKRCHTGEKRFVCSICQRGFAEKYLLKRHSIVHTGERPYECKTCGCSFKNSSLLKYHGMIHDYTKTINNCQKCDKTCPCGEHVMEYKMMMEKKPFICEKCYMCFKCHRDLVYHTNNHKGEIPFMCDKCGKGFNNKSHFLRHSSTHTGKKPYQCTYCDKRYAQKANLTVHIKTTHIDISNSAQGSKVQCNKCEKWIFSSRYKRHLRTHENESEKKCSHCGKVLSTIHALRLHNRIHTGEKPFQCSECDAAFAQRHSLDFHKATKHSDEKPFQCKTCQKGFVARFRLTRHEKTHKFRVQKE